MGLGDEAAASTTAPPLIRRPIPIAEVRTPRWDRHAGRSWPHGSGLGTWRRVNACGSHRAATSCGHHPPRSHALPQRPWPLADGSLRHALESLDGVPARRRTVHGPPGAPLLPQAPLVPDPSFRLRHSGMARPKTCAACPIRHACLERQLDPPLLVPSARSASCFPRPLLWDQQRESFRRCAGTMSRLGPGVGRSSRLYVPRTSACLTALPGDPPRPLPGSPRAERSHHRGFPSRPGKRPLFPGTLRCSAIPLLVTHLVE